jgi:malonate transporter
MVIINALGPIFLLVLLGVLFRRFHVPGAEFWPLAERMTYFVFFPALLVASLATAPFTVRDLGEVFVVVLILMGGTSAILILGARWLEPSGPAFTSVFQGTIRFNSYVGFAAAAGLWGEAGLGIAALIVACLVPLVNLLCIAVFALKVGRTSPLAKQIVLNPLILACAIGIGLNLTEIGLPGWSEDLLEILGRPALPLGLLAIGVGLNWQGMRAAARPLLTTSALKLLLMPGAAYLVARGFELEPSYTAVLVLFCALPSATSSYILARQLDGDAPLMAAIITVQTLAAMATMPLVLGFLVLA